MYRHVVGNVARRLAFLSDFSVFPVTENRSIWTDRQSKRERTWWIILVKLREQMLFVHAGTLHMDGKVWFLIATVFQNDRLFNVRRPAGSHIHPKSGSIKEMARDRHIVTTHHYHYSCHFQWPWMTLKVIRLMQDLSVINAIRRTCVRYLARF